MSILNLNVQDAKPVTLLEDGEYELRIIHAETKTSKSGNEYVNLRMEALDNPTADDVYHMMMLPSQDESKFKDKDDMVKQNNKRLNAFIEFGKAFNVDPANLDLESLHGEVGRALIGSKSDPEYGEKNVVKRFLPAR
jgi:hypothetical protein